MEYIGLTSDTFKSRYNGHTETFRNKEGKSTALSSHIWSLEDDNKNYDIKWSIKKRAKTYSVLQKSKHGVLHTYVVALFSTP